jgi:hypothetical protein
MIVDKKNDLNIYKQDIRKIEKEQKEVAASCCSSNRTKETKPATSCCSADNRSAQKQGAASACCSLDELKEAKAASCYGPAKPSAEEANTKASNGSCGTSDQIGDDVVKKVTEIDFNEWVGKLVPIPDLLKLLLTIKY